MAMTSEVDLIGFQFPLKNPDEPPILKTVAENSHNNDRGSADVTANSDGYFTEIVSGPGKKIDELVTQKTALPDNEGINGHPSTYQPPSVTKEIVADDVIKRTSPREGEQPHGAMEKLSQENGEYSTTNITIQPVKQQEPSQPKEKAQLQEMAQSREPSQEKSFPYRAPAANEGRNARLLPRARAFPTGSTNSFETKGIIHQKPKSNLVSTRPNMGHRPSFSLPAESNKEKDPLLDGYKPYEWASISRPISNKTIFLDDMAVLEEKKAKALLREQWVRGVKKVMSQNQKLKSEYRHTPLKDGEIRLLHLEPYKVSRNEPLEAKVLRRKLLSQNVYRKFAALSYHWGDDDPSEEISLIEDNPVLSSVFPLGTEEKQIKPDTVQTISQILEAKRPRWLKIQKNLVAALKALRLSEKEGPLLLWVDAICIIQMEGKFKGDKNDKYNEMARKEQAEQVTKMAEIYNAAFNVCIWLGDGDAKTKRGMEFILSLMDLGKLENHIQNEEYREDWNALRHIMRAKWFSRRWVVQEICVARRATVHFGSEVVHWEDFADAIAIFMENMDTITTMFTDSSSEKLHDVAGLGANQLVTTLSNLSHRTIGGSILKQLVGLESLVCTLLYFETRRPHDAIYSLLTIARDTPQTFFGDGSNIQKKEIHNTEFPIMVDYDKDPIDLFIEFTKGCIETSHSLDIICRHWAPDVLHERRIGRQIVYQAIKFPSWIQKISDSAFGQARDAIRGRRKGDSLVGCPYRGTRKSYNAASGSSASVTYKYVEETLTEEPESIIPEIVAPVNPGTIRWAVSAHAYPMSPTTRRSTIHTVEDWNPERILQVEGIVLAEVKRQSDRITNGNIPAKWLKLAGYNPKDYNVPDRLWRTLVADRGPDGDLPPRWYKRACQHCLNDEQIMTTTEDLNTQGTTNSAMAQKFLSRVRNVVWNRQFFQAGEELEFFGLMPEKARTSDFICILKGCTVPVVLQPVVIRSKPNIRCYELVGEAYVYGAMDGEWFHNRMPTETFIIR